jgi:hypothetical protein
MRSRRGSHAQKRAVLSKCDRPESADRALGAEQGNARLWLDPAAVIRNALVAEMPDAGDVQGTPRMILFGPGDRVGLRGERRERRAGVGRLNGESRCFLVDEQAVCVGVR